MNSYLFHGFPFLFSIIAFTVVDYSSGGKKN